MSQEIRYGRDASIQVQVPPESLVADCTHVLGDRLDEPAEATRAALSDPLDFPPLAQAVVPGDRVVIALEAGVPLAGAVVEGVIRSIGPRVLDHCDVSVLLAPDQDGVEEQPAIAALRAALDRLQVRLSVHDPADRSALSYLAAAKDASPIYLNRALCDADVVLPVGATRPDSSLGYLGIPGGLYPTFSDESTLRRFRAPAAARHAGQNAKRRDQAAEVAWLLGVSLFLQVVPGSGTSLLHVVAGQPDRVAKECRQLCERAWVHRVPRKADLVVAAIEGDSTEQTWDNLGRALFSASQICTDNGTIVLCTDLDRPPGPALRQLANATEDEQARRQVLRQRSADAVAATVLLDTRDRQHVYLLSRLDADFVESLGFGYVPDPFTVERLAEQSASCILLADAHRAQLEPVE